MRSPRRHRVDAVILVAIAAVASALFLCACSSGAASTSQITVAGSTTVLPIAEIAAEGFEAKTGTQVLVSGLGSSAGIEAAINGTADIASSSRGLNADENGSGLVATVIAHDGIAVIVNDSNPVSGLTLSQLRDIYEGKITNWNEVGGPDLRILLVNRDEASGTREAFRSIVMGDASFDAAAAVLPGTGQVRDVVSRTPGAIGYISIGFVESDTASTTVKSLALDGVAATEDAVESGRYPISRDLYFFTMGQPTGSAAAYIDYVLSDDMAETIREAGYIPVGSSSAGEGGSR